MSEARLKIKKNTPLLIGVLIAIFPFIGFNYKVFRGLSCHFVHTFERLASFPFTVPPLFQKYILFCLTDFIILIAFLGVCFSREIKIKTLFFNRHSRYLSLYTVVAFLSILFSLFAKYFFQYTTLINLTIAFLGFHLSYTLFKKRPQLIPLILWGFLAFSALECLIGIGQFIMQRDLGLQFLSEPIITPYMDNIAVFPLASGKQFFFGILPWIQEDHSLILRAYGTFGHPNIFAGYLTMTLFVSYYCYLSAKKRSIRRAILIFIPIQILTLALTFARGGFFAWILGSFVFFIVPLFKSRMKDPISKKAYLTLLTSVGLGLLISLFLLYSYFYDRGGYVNYNDYAGASDAGRILFYRIACLFVLNFPLLGAGFNSYAIFPYEKLSSNLLGVNTVGALSHNIYLQIAAETGLIGLSLLLLFIFSLYKPYLKQQLTLLSLTLGTLFFALLLIGLVDHYLIAYTPGRLMFFSFAGLFAASSYESAPKVAFYKICENQL